MQCSIIKRDCTRLVSYCCAHVMFFFFLIRYGAYRIRKQIVRSYKNTQGDNDSRHVCKFYASKHLNDVYTVLFEHTTVLNGFLHLTRKLMDSENVSICNRGD